jgi:hypothetical protein
MKTLYPIALIAVISISISSCLKNSDIVPFTPTRQDTNKTLITNTKLVGNWKIVTDTISFGGSSVMYHGIATDYYKFTKYGNLYINEGLNKLIDTAIYGITTTTNQVNWVNNYTSVNGVVSINQSLSPPFVITKVDSANLILTSSVSTTAGPRYEQIVFKK